ncbi:MAG: nitrilase-related carbon-nitrogen hydrolase [Myxococcota bacterium]
MSLPKLHLAVVQCALSDDRRDNVSRIEAWVREAASRGAEVVLTPELFEGHYFPQHEREVDRDRAQPVEGHPTLARFRTLARELHVVLPVSIYEAEGDARYNSLVLIDEHGEERGVYRKSHIPDGPGYEEKFYFDLGNTGFRTWETGAGHLGIGVCWDQWFPEAARAMALRGAEVLLYPTAIGTEPATPAEDSRDPWRRVMIGHAVANATPVAAANRVGTEGEITFYGSSFICDHRGDVVAELGRDEEGVVVGAIDRDALARYRANWNFAADRRPDLYQELTHDDDTA